MIGAGGNEVCDPPAVCEFSALSLRRTLAGHKSHRLLRVPPIRLLPVPESHARDDANREHTQVENLCYERLREAARGCPCPGAGVAFSAKPGWRSGESIERAEGRMPVVSVRRWAWAAPSGAEGTGCQPLIRRGTGCQPVLRGAWATGRMLTPWTAPRVVPASRRGGPVARLPGR